MTTRTEVRAFLRSRAVIDISVRAAIKPNTVRLYRLRVPDASGEWKELELVQTYQDKEYET